ncbi:universal stress protein [Kitasatospora sp. NPDC101447]|uniref:universal stress protein n=1 Tax=Kitasatospora sp. NPDC101447 TaxID=3364102 RepID=UPI0038032ADD
MEQVPRPRPRSARHQLRPRAPVRRLRPADRHRGVEHLRAPPARVLLDTSQGADLLVVGSRGTGLWGRLSLGSTSTEIVQHAHLPVVVVPHSPEHATGGTAPANRRSAGRRAGSAVPNRPGRHDVRGRHRPFREPIREEIADDVLLGTL